MQQQDCVRKCWISPRLHGQFCVGYKSGSVDYDVKMDKETVAVQNSVPWEVLRVVWYKTDVDMVSTYLLYSIPFCTKWHIKLMAPCRQGRQFLGVVGPHPTNIWTCLAVLIKVARMNVPSLSLEIVSVEKHKKGQVSLILNFASSCYKCSIYPFVSNSYDE